MLKGAAKPPCRFYRGKKSRTHLRLAHGSHRRRAFDINFMAPWARSTQRWLWGQGPSSRTAARVQPLPQLLTAHLPNYCKGLCARSGSQPAPLQSRSPSAVRNPKPRHTALLPHTRAIPGPRLPPQPKKGPTTPQGNEEAAELLPTSLTSAGQSPLALGLPDQARPGVAEPRRRHCACAAAARPRLPGKGSAPGPGRMASLVPTAASSPAGAASRGKKRPASPGTGPAKKKKATAPGGSQVMVRGGRPARMRGSELPFPALSRRAGRVSRSPSRRAGPRSRYRGCPGTRRPPPRLPRPPASSPSVPPEAAEPSAVSLGRAGPFSGRAVGHSFVALWHGGCVPSPPCAQLDRWCRSPPFPGRVCGRMRPGLSGMPWKLRL